MTLPYVRVLFRLKGRITMKKALSLLLALTLIFALSLPVFAETLSVYSSYLIPYGSVRMTAHRGYSSVAPENTLPAFRLAGEYGFWGAECDTSPTSDGVWIIMHDDTVDRMTDRTGKVGDLTYADITALTIDAGANVTDYPDTKVPTLTEYLDVCKDYGLNPVIEVKPSAPVGRMGDLAELLSAREEKDRFVIISFSRELLTALKPLLPDTPMYLLCSPATEDDIAFCLDNGIDGVDFSSGTPKETVRAAIKAGLKVMVWTIDDTDTVEQFYQWGVRDFTTNALTQNNAEGNALQELLWDLRDIFYHITEMFRMFRRP